MQLRFLYRAGVIQQKKTNIETLMEKGCGCLSASKSRWGNLGKGRVSGGHAEMQRSMLVYLSVYIFFAPLNETLMWLDVSLYAYQKPRSMLGATISHQMFVWACACVFPCA